MTAPTTHARLRGRVVPQAISELYWLHCWLINHRITVPADEWASDLGLIASALGFPPGQDGRDVVARWIFVDSLAGDKRLQVAS